jgi:thiamine biosynthesis lipoprotein
VSIWKTKDGVQLDVNAFAPGYAADLIGKMLESHKVNNFMIDISGEFVVRGDKGNGHQWVIGIEKPSLNYADGVQQILSVTNESIATSGNYRQFYNEKGEKLSHIIDPRTGHPVNNGIASASVITSNGAMADGWATAMMILGEEGISIAQKHGVKVFLLKTKSKDQYEEVITDDFKTHLIQTK